MSISSASLSSDTEYVCKFGTAVLIHVAAITLIVLGAMHALGTSNATGIVAGCFIGLISGYCIYQMLKNTSELPDDPAPTPAIFSQIDTNPDKFQVLNRDLINVQVDAITQRNLDVEINDHNPLLTSTQLHRYFEYIETEFPSLDIPVVDESIYCGNIDTLFLTPLKKVPKDSLSKQFAIFFRVGEDNWDTDHSKRNHWTLIFIDRHMRTIEYYDPMMLYGDYKEVDARLTTLADEFTKLDPGTHPYVYQRKITKKVQQDAHQCGVWVAYYAHMRAKFGDKIDFNQMGVKASQAIIERYRHHVKQQIANMSNLRAKAIAYEKSLYSKKYPPIDGEGRYKEWERRYDSDVHLTYRNGIERNPIMRRDPQERWQHLLAGKFLIPKD